ncbi:hypothetical protein PsYK624_167850 [Phanerochaete sordida]|uniref:Uncharacterized protein n=1 Tax=Phanerochaete sordida TaxID=48140 RepID=A0A9P3LMJ7_9APHY|nr:hypothetical protein PsYK624_167850 [Phanerochaete sordida]
MSITSAGHSGDSMHMGAGDGAENALAVLRYMVIDVRVREMTGYLWCLVEGRMVKVIKSAMEWRDKPRSSTPSLLADKSTKTLLVTSPAVRTTLRL